MYDIATPPRSEVPVERTWNSESVFATVEDWEAELEAILADLSGLGRTRRPARGGSPR